MSKFDHKRFGADIRKRMSKCVKKVTMKTLKGPVVLHMPGGAAEAAAEVGIAVSTMLRIQKKVKPDIDTFARVCAWMKKDPSRYFRG